MDSEEEIAKYKNKDIYTYTESKLDHDHLGYSNAEYELDIKVEFVQADEDGEAAIANDWNWWPGKE